MVATTGCTLWPSEEQLRCRRQTLREIRARIETALAACAPGHEREAVLAALAEVEKRLGKGITKNADDLSPLIREWIHLMFRYRRLQKLRQLKDQLQRPVISE